MWRRPVGPAGSGPARPRTPVTDYDPMFLGVKIVDGRRLTQQFLDEMEAARADTPPDVDFVQQMRERKADGTSEGYPATWTDGNTQALNWSSQGHRS